MSSPTWTTSSPPVAPDWFVPSSFDFDLYPTAKIEPKDEGIWGNARLKSSTKSGTVQVTYTLHDDEYITFYSAFQTTLRYGRRWFIALIPTGLGLQWMYCRISEPYQASPLGGSGWTLTMKMEIRRRATGSSTGLGGAGGFPGAPPPAPPTPPPPLPSHASVVLYEDYFDGTSTDIWNHTPNTIYGFHPYGHNVSNMKIDGAGFLVPNYTDNPSAQPAAMIKDFQDGSHRVQIPVKQYVRMEQTATLNKAYSASTYPISLAFGSRVGVEFSFEVYDSIGNNIIAVWVIRMLRPDGSADFRTSYWSRNGSNPGLWDVVNYDHTIPNPAATHSLAITVGNGLLTIENLTSVIATHTVPNINSDGKLLSVIRACYANDPTVPPPPYDLFKIAHTRFTTWDAGVVPPPLVGAPPPPPPPPPPAPPAVNATVQCRTTISANLQVGTSTLPGPRVTSFTNQTTQIVATNNQVISGKRFPTGSFTTSSCILINSGVTGVQIRDCDFQQSRGNACIELYGDHCTIEYNNIKHGNRGVLGSGSGCHDNLVQKNVLDDFSNGVFPQSTALEFDNTTNNVVRDNLVYGTSYHSDSVSFYQSSGCKFMGNYIEVTMATGDSHSDNSAAMTMGDAGGGDPGHDNYIAGNVFKQI